MCNLHNMTPFLFPIFAIWIIHCQCQLSFLFESKKLLKQFCYVLIIFRWCFDKSTSPGSCNLLTSSCWHFSFLKYHRLILSVIKELTDSSSFLFPTNIIGVSAIAFPFTSFIISTMGANSANDCLLKHLVWIHWKPDHSSHFVTL